MFFIFLFPVDLRAQSPPPCATPARLTEPFTCELQTYIVLLHNRDDLNALLASIQTRYGLTPSAIFNPIGAFAIRLTAQEVALLRCEPAVRQIEPSVAFCRPSDPCPPEPSSGPCPAFAPIPVLSEAGRWALVAILAVAAMLVLRQA